MAIMLSFDDHLYVEPDSFTVILIFTFICCLLFVSGILGNTITCFVILQNRLMHTPVNIYLFSLAVSDVLLLLCSLPLEIYRLWNPLWYPFTDAMCKTVGFISETSTYATIMIIEIITVERYLAICHPFISRKVSNFSKAIIYVAGIWMIALCSALPQMMRFEKIIYEKNRQIISVCTLKTVEWSFYITSSLFFFLVPMSLIIILYVLITIKLQTSRVLYTAEMPSVESGDRSGNTLRYRRKAIRMLVAVTLSFFLCWAPFHLQRLLVIYGKNLEHPTDTFYKVNIVLTHLSTMLYFLSTSINPLLYSIMSNKFRNAFKDTLLIWCTRGDRSQLERTHSDPLAPLGERDAARVSPRPRNPRLPRRFSTAPSLQFDSTPRAQDTLLIWCTRGDRSQLERTHSDPLAPLGERDAARVSPRPRNPRLPRRFSTAPSLQFDSTPRAQDTLLIWCTRGDRSQLERTHSDPLAPLGERDAARVSPRPRNPRLPRRFSTAPSLQFDSTPRAQASSEGA